MFMFKHHMLWKRQSESSIGADNYHMLWFLAKFTVRIL